MREPLDKVYNVIFCAHISSYFLLSYREATGTRQAPTVPGNISWGICLGVEGCSQKMETHQPYGMCNQVCLTPQLHEEGEGEKKERSMDTTTCSIEWFPNLIPQPEVDGGY